MGVYLYEKIVYNFKMQNIFKDKLNTNDINSKIEKRDFTTPNESSIKEITKNNNKYKILIVEDDPANRKIIKGQLKAAKCNIIVAEDGKQALNAINKFPDIDVVLLDLILPDISGFDVCKKIREKYTMYEKPVIMVTSKNYIKDLVEGFEVGANDFITKPYNVYELIARINSSISLKNVFEDNTSLKKINKLKSDIVDMAAHDLKSPLTIIAGYAKRILKLVKPESKESENTIKILNSSTKMLSIINKLLIDSRYEKKVMKFKNVNIEHIINQSIDFYRDMATNKNQKITFTNKNSNNILFLDKNSIITILDNLLSNAIKFSPIEGKIKISLTEDSKNVHISIKDSGNGFTQDEIDNLFIKYFPFTNKPTQGEDSTGLGLYIVNDMVTRNRGEIIVDSTRGKGSEFIISFLKS